MQKDAGIWEIRSQLRHHVSSKLLCWSALDRGVLLAEKLHLDAPVEKWRQERDKIRAAILERGWSERRRSFVGSFDGDDLDAAVLLMPLLRFLPADDPRMLETISCVQRELTVEGLVRRYLSDDGLVGREGAFVICTFWLVSCLAKAGMVEEASALFEQVHGFANDLGLLAEEIDPASGEQLGNFPQAFSHVGLINANHIDEARGRP